MISLFSVMQVFAMVALAWTISVSTNMWWIAMAAVLLVSNGWFFIVGIVNEIERDNDPHQ